MIEDSTQIEQGRWKKMTTRKAEVTVI